MTKEINLVIRDKKYIITGLFLKACHSLNLTIDELYILIYLENSNNNLFEPDEISDLFDIPKNDVLLSFNTLMTKGIIDIDNKKDADGRIQESITINGIYNKINELVKNKNQESKKENIFACFEKEFGRPISPMEYEIINAWLSTGISEELILEALKEAVYNGAKSFRYIDKIIFTWSEKGFKTAEDVKKHINTKKETKVEELFDYNWLEDNDN